MNNNQIEEYGVTLGFGFPLKNSYSAINVAFEFGQSGVYQSNVIEQTYGKIHLNFRLHEIWFQKYQYR